MRDDTIPEIQPNVGRVAASDIEELAIATWPWDVRIDQLSPGQLCHSREYVQFEGLIMYRECFKPRNLFIGTSPPGYIMIGASTSGADVITMNGSRLEPDRLALASHDSCLEFTTPKNSTHAVMLVPEDRMGSYMDNRFFAEAVKTGSLMVPPKNSKRFTQLFGQFFDNCIKRLDSPRNTNEARKLEASVYEALNVVFSYPTDDRARPEINRRWKIVMRALECLDVAVSVYVNEELAREIGVSERTLQYAFKETIGVAPSGFERLRRLNGCHRDLSDIEPDSSTTVTDVATRWGFNELGRFAGEYRRIFGESPSTTLSKNRPAPTLLLADFCKGRPRPVHIQHRP